MRLVSLLWAWLVGYYYLPCPVCGRYTAILSGGRIVGWCNKRVHAKETPR